jgi:hypothetical protein
MVALRETGIASGTNNALRELGGVFGVAVLASVFNPAWRVRLTRHVRRGVQIRAPDRCRILGTRESRTRC